LLLQDNSGLGPHHFFLSLHTSSYLKLRPGSIEVLTWAMHLKVGIAIEVIGQEPDP
jgi:hypothetical protein